MITACVCVKDEAGLLAGCLASLRGVAARVVVVDNGSRDGSGDVARAHGAEVIDGARVPYGRARNLYLEAVRDGWVLVIDADERLGAASRGLARFLASRGETPDAFALPRYEYTGRGRFSVVEVVRLFRAHRDVRYFESSAHASVVPAIEARGGRLLPGPIALHHVDLLHPGRAFEKRARARARAEAELGRPGASPLLHAYLGLELAALGRWGEALDAFARSAASDPRCAPTASLFAAHVHDALGDFAAAAREARRALEGPPDFRGRHNAHVVLAQCALSRGELPAATHHALLARAARPRYASAHVNLAALARARGAPSEPHLARARRLNPWLGSPAIAVEADRPSLYPLQRSLLSLDG